MYDGGHGADQLPESLDRPGLAGDVGAGVRFLRDQGYKKVVLIANSAGGPVMSLYQSQAENLTIKSTPDGDPYDIIADDLPGKVCDLFYERSDQKIKLSSRSKTSLANTLLTEDLQVLDVEILDASIQGKML